MPEDFAPALGHSHAADPLTLLSVVVPVRNEGPNILPLIAEIRRALAGQAYEIVYVDDGSKDDTAARLAEAAAIPGAPLRWLRQRASCGQSAAILTGVRAATGAWIATLDGDSQNDPTDIPVLLERGAAAEKSGCRPVLVAGERSQRQDNLAKRLASQVATGFAAVSCVTARVTPVAG